MQGFKRWMLVTPIAISMIGFAFANETPDPPATAMAKAAVAEAESAVRQAQAERALWTSAEEALRKARRALLEGNTAMAIEQARIALNHSELGIAQKSYPSVR